MEAGEHFNLDSAVESRSQPLRLAQTGRLTAPGRPLGSRRAPHRGGRAVSLVTIAFPRPTIRSQFRAFSASPLRRRQRMFWHVF